MDDGTVMILCHSGSRPKPGKCAYCDRPHIALCDWLLIKEKRTCDKPLCKIHAMKPIPEFGKVTDIDYCPDHYQQYKQQMLEVKHA